MTSEDKVDVEERLENVGDERNASVETFAREGKEGLAELEQERNEKYFKPKYELYENDYAPFLFTKGMPLDVNEEDEARYPEGIVSFERKLDTYQEPIRREPDFSDDDAFEQGGQRLFIGVPGVYTVGLSGMEAWLGRMPKAPDPTGSVTAREMIDVYAMEQLRDVPFTAWPNEPNGDGGRSVSEIEDDEDAPAALKDTIGALREDLGEADNKGGKPWYGVDRLFVEADVGSDDWWGPYVSQFLLHEVELWSLPVEQQYLRYQEGVDYNRYLEDWLNTLEGMDENASETNPATPSSEDRGYLSTPRHLATIVNAEPPYQEYLIAALRLLELEFDSDLAYQSRDSESGVLAYTGGGPVGLLDMIARAGRQALLAAFYQKYYHHFRCRPETYGGRVHAQRHNRHDFEIPDLLAESEILSVRDHETDYLSTAYVEGSPVHPAYPSGHSVIAGACGTVLKTWFPDLDWKETGLDYLVVEHGDNQLGEDTTSIEVPDGHNGLYQEIDKLISNVGLARMFAGVHYYSDHYEGVKLGEQVAVGLLADIFGRTFSGSEENTPTFQPYLQYDDDPVRIEPGETDGLDSLREAAVNRDPGESPTG